MDIRLNLEKEHSKRNTMVLSDYIIHNKTAFGELMECLLHGSYILQQRAAWPLSYIVESRPEYGNRYFVPLVLLLETPDLHPAVYRNIWKSMIFIKIPEANAGQVIDLAYRFILSVSEPVACKVYAMEAIYPFIVRFPEMQPEFLLTIESALPGASAGYISKVKHIRKALQKGIKKLR